MMLRLVMVVLYVGVSAPYVYSSVDDSILRDHTVSLFTAETLASTDKSTSTETQKNIIIIEVIPVCTDNHTKCILWTEYYGVECYRIRCM
jgi:hypothetical protein